MNDVEGKVAVVTGGDSGIGLGIARAFLGAGMKVAITYRTRAHLDESMKALEHAGDRVCAIPLDVTDREAMDRACAQVRNMFGKVHVLVNNAGVALLLPISCTTFDDWDWCMSVNVDGVFNGIRAFLPHIRAHGEGGHIVATASMLGGLVAGPLWGAYSASKFAVVGMMEALRAELEATNIGVSIFCPAGVESNLNRSERNRPATFPEAGELDTRGAEQMSKFQESMTQLLAEYPISSSIMDSTEAGEWVLRGIRRNDMYILSHPEYEHVLRDRWEALAASIPRHVMPPQGRVMVARFYARSLYRNELNRMRRQND